MSTTQQRAPHRIRRGALTTATTTALAVLVLTGCSPAAPSDGAKKTPSSTAPSATAAAKPAVATVPGYDVGQFPPVPLFRLPDLGLLSGSADAFAIEVDKSFADVPGVTVSPARCDDGGKVVSGAGSAMLYGDGSGNYTGPDGTVQNFGDGSGVSTINGVTIENFGDGSGNYTSGSVRISIGRCALIPIVPDRVKLSCLPDSISTCCSYSPKLKPMLASSTTSEFAIRCTMYGFTVIESACWRMPPLKDL